MNNLAAPQMKTSGLEGVAADLLLKQRSMHAGQESHGFSLCHASRRLERYHRVLVSLRLPGRHDLDFLYEGLALYSSRINQRWHPDQASTILTQIS